MRKRRLNSKGFRIMITMLACIATFKVATIVSNANSLPGVEYRASTTEIGWSKWARNKETCGDISVSKKIEAVKMILTDVEDGCINYKVYVAGQGWTDIQSNGITAGGTSGIQGIKVALDGDVSQTYDIKYRVHMLGGAWTEWIKGPEVAGDISSAAFFMVAAAIIPDSSIIIKNVVLRQMN